MVGYKVLYLGSLITFSIGAFTFAVLTLFYWRERILRKPANRDLVFPAFTLVCAVAFLINLLFRIGSALAPDSQPFTTLSIALQLTASLLPPLLFHLIYKEERAASGRRTW